MKRKFLVLGVALICLLCICGCTAVKYNAVLYDNAAEWINEDFVKDNYTSGAFYDGERTDDSYPTSKVFVIRSNEDKADILNDSFNVDIDFEKEMILVYTWTTVYHRDCKIENIELKNDVLYVDYKMASVAVGVGDASMPFQRWFVVKLDLLPITSVEFNEI